MFQKLNLKRTIGDAYNPKRNSFHLIRFLLAIGVIFSHSYALLGLKGEITYYLTNRQFLMSTFSVDGFFVVSGFLVTQSLLSSTNSMEFLIKRFLRIMPAFTVSLVVSGFVLSPIITTTNLSLHFIHDILNFIVKNITFGIHGDKFGIIGVFTNNPYPNVINGSMWTLKHEIALYLIFGLLLAFPFLKTHSKIVLTGGLITILTFFHLLFGFELTKSTNVYYWVLNAWNYKDFINLAFFFLYGSTVYLYKDKIPINWLVIGIMAAGLLISIQTRWLLYGSMLFFPYLLVAVSINPTFSAFQRLGDFSYGLYIYAFPTQQLVVFLFKKHLTVSSFFIISVLITLLISIFSWHYIEKPALSLKSKLIFAKRQFTAEHEINVTTQISANEQRF